jgi:hypothetical protein
VARSLFKLNEESLRVVLFYQRFAINTHREIGMPNFFFKSFAKKVLKGVVAQGYGLHSSEESEWA